MKNIDTKICKYCKDPYPKPYSSSKKVWANSKYCCRMCYGKAMRGKKKPKNKNWQKNNYLAIISSYKNGRVPYWKGKKRPEFGIWFKKYWKEGNMNHRKKLYGSKNPSWCGDQTSYTGIHKWLANHYVKLKKCQFCPATNCRIEFALKRNLKKYTRDINDYWQLCVSCHKNYDNLNKYEKF